MEKRQATLFRIGDDQAVKIPAEFELPGHEAIINQVGDRITIEPIRKRDLLALLASMEPFDEPFPEID